MLAVQVGDPGEATGPDEALAALRRAYPRALAVSAVTGQGIDHLRDRIVMALAGREPDDSVSPHEPAHLDDEGAPAAPAVAAD